MRCPPEKEVAAETSDDLTATLIPHCSALSGVGGREIGIKVELGKKGGVGVRCFIFVVSHHPTPFLMDNELSPKSGFSCDSLYPNSKAFPPYFLFLSC